jgi:Carboxypeptidase regulatory-like domain
MRSAILFIVLLACVSFPLYAQNANVSGQVTDAQQAVVARASVTLTRTSTQVSVHTVTSADGRFLLPPVIPGNYEVLVTANGFSPTRITGITLEIGESKVLNVELKVSGESSSVYVTDAPPELVTDSANRSLMIEPALVNSIPLNIRNPLQMISDAAGVTKGDDGLSGQDSTSESRTNTFRINGAKGATTDVLLDGAANTTAYYNQDAGIPTVDAVQEYRVYTDAYAPEFGRTSGGMVTYALRSGTDKLHGSGFEYYRDQAMDANGFNADLAGQPKGSFGRNQFGFSLGGPVILPHLYNGQHKTFFFVSYDGLRDTAAGSFTGTVPTALERQGDFSQTFDAKGNLIVIYDPSTTIPTSTGYSRTPIPGNKITNLDPIGKALLSLYPLPNQHGTGASDLNNYFSNAPNTDDNNAYDIRIDHQISKTQSIFGHYTHFSNRINYSDYFGNGLSPEDANDRIPGINFDVNHTWAIRPDLLVEHHFSWAHSESNRNESVLKSPASLGFNSSVAPGITANLTPQLSISGPTSVGSESTLGNYYPYERNYSSVWQYAADSTWVKRNHTFKFGIDVRRYPTQLWDPEQMSITAGTSFTNGPGTTTPSSDSGEGMAELLLGLATVTTGYEPETRSVHYYEGVYAEDTYKMTRKLTVIYGLRYNYETGDVEKNNLLNYLDTTHVSPIQSQIPSLNLTGGVGVPGLYGMSRQLQVPAKLNFDPRLGVAYQLNSKTIVHAGFGIFHHPAAAWQQYPNADGGIRVSTSIDAESNGKIPLAGYTLANPFPSGLPQPYGDSAGLGIDLGQSIAGPLRTQSISYQENWSFDVQRELPANFVVTADYSGNEGVHLMQPVQLNQIPDADLALGSKLLSTVSNPFHGVITDPSSTLSLATVNYEQLLRPYPQFLNFEAINDGVGHSTYHAGQLTVEHRLKQGLAMTLAYTFSKAIDNVGEMTSVAGTYTSFQNVHCPKCDRSRSDLNETHVIRWNTSYELPFGQHRAFLNHGVVSDILGGWNVATVYSLDTGRPLSVSSPNYSYSFSSGNFRPDLTGESDSTPGGSQVKLGKNYFNPAAFKETPAYTFGTAPRYLSNIDLPLAWNLDAMLEKSTQLGEGYLLSFRAEAFNALNNVTFTGPTTSVTSSTFGQEATLSQTNTARQVQLSLRVTF